MKEIVKGLNPDFIILIIFGIVMSIVFIAITFFNKKKKILRLLSKLPDKTIGNIRTNEFTKISGEAFALKEPLIAPLSKNECIFYHLKIEQQKKRGKNNYWKTILLEEKIQEFLIKKNGDIAMVFPTNHPKNYIHYVSVAKKKIAFSKMFNEPSSDLDALLKKHQIGNINFLNANNKVRFSEVTIVAGENITVAGIGKMKSLEEPIEGYSYAKLMSLGSNEKQKLIITNLPSKKSKRKKRM